MLGADALQQCRRHRQEQSALLAGLAQVVQQVQAADEAVEHHRRLADARQPGERRFADRPAVRADRDQFGRPAQRLAERVDHRAEAAPEADLEVFAGDAAVRGLPQRKAAEVLAVYGGEKGGKQVVHGDSRTGDAGGFEERGGHLMQSIRLYSYPKSIWMYFIIRFYA
ncbi:hypothetical protein DWG20_02750 [Crenobacter cavernae]|uniref:Uncharacterized protein n=1 Tax=Crenobacter cavernae TaxID=2290923 RepID=A0A345Y3D2_9NEIS|nr:hypothetical protein DWG20_02750 [Crenobacter cavernae]